MSEISLGVSLGIFLDCIVTTKSAKEYREKRQEKYREIRQEKCRENCQEQRQGFLSVFLLAP